MSTLRNLVTRFEFLFLGAFFIYAFGVVYTNENLTTSISDAFVVYGAVGLSILFVGYTVGIKHRRTGDWRRQFVDPWGYAVYERDSIDEFEMIHAITVYVLLAIAIGVGVQVMFRLLDLAGVTLTQFFYVPFSQLVTIPLVLGIIVGVKWLFQLEVGS